MSELLVDPFNIMSRKTENLVLYNLIDFYLQKWKLLIIKHRGYRNLDWVFSRTLDHVIENFNGDWSSLESYTKTVALTIDLKRKTDSLDILVNDDGDTLQNLLSDQSSINQYDVFKVSKKRHKSYLDNLDSLWVSFISELEDTVLDNDEFDEEDITNTLLSTPILQQAYQYKLEEIANVSIGVTEGQHTYYYNFIIKRLVAIFNGDNDFVKDNYKKWLVIYLNHRDLFNTLYSLLVTSNVIPYNNSKKEKRSSDFFVKDGKLVRRQYSKRKVYRFDLTEQIDNVIDFYYNEHSYMSFEIFGVRFYNVLSGIFVRGGDLGSYLRETLIEAILHDTNFEFIGVRGEVVYFSSKGSESFYLQDLWYFGIGVSIVGEKIDLERFNSEIMGGD